MAATGSAAAGGAPPVSPQPAAAGSAERAAKRAATCDKVLAEIVSTERLYLSNLQQVVSVYLKPLQAAHTQADLGLKPAHLQAIFANLEGIGQSHAQGRAGAGKRRGRMGGGAGTAPALFARACCRPEWGHSYPCRCPLVGL